MTGRSVERPKRERHTQYKRSITTLGTTINYADDAWGWGKDGRLGRAVISPDRRWTFRCLIFHRQFSPLLLVGLACVGRQTVVEELVQIQTNGGDKRRPRRGKAHSACCPRKCATCQVEKCYVSCVFDSRLQGGAVGVRPSVGCQEKARCGRLSRRNKLRSRCDDSGEPLTANNMVDSTTGS